MAEANAKEICYCSFCGKSQYGVRKLIAGPTAYICDECIELCGEIVEAETRLATPEFEFHPYSHRESLDALNIDAFALLESALGPFFQRPSTASLSIDEMCSKLSNAATVILYQNFSSEQVRATNHELLESLKFLSTIKELTPADMAEKQRLELRLSLFRSIWKDIPPDLGD